MSNVIEVPQAELLIDMETLLTVIFVIVDDWYQDTVRRIAMRWDGVLTYLHPSTGSGQAPTIRDHALTGLSLDFA